MNTKLRPITNQIFKISAIKGKKFNRPRQLKATTAHLNWLDRLQQPFHQVALKEWIPAQYLPMLENHLDSSAIAEKLKKKVKFKDLH